MILLSNLNSGKVMNSINSVLYYCILGDYYIIEYFVKLLNDPVSLPPFIVFYDQYKRDEINSYSYLNVKQEL